MTVPENITVAEASQLCAAKRTDCVLVVDDDSAQRELLKRFLEREGFAVRLAEDGKKGLDMARELIPVFLEAVSSWKASAPPTAP